MKFKVMLACCMLLLFSACGNDSESATPESPWPAFENIVELRMRNGQSGELLTTRNIESIQPFLQFMKSLNYTKANNQDQGVGYLYYIDFLDKDGKETRVTSMNRMLQIHQTYYDVDQPTTPVLQQLENALRLGQPLTLTEGDFPDEHSFQVTITVPEGLELIVG